MSEDREPYGDDNKEERETVDLQDLVISNTITNSALAQILIKKGIATNEEIMAEIASVEKEVREKKGMSSH